MMSTVSNIHAPVYASAAVIHVFAL